MNFPATGPMVLYIDESLCNKRKLSNTPVTMFYIALILTIFLKVKSNQLKIQSNRIKPNHEANQIQQKKFI